MSNIDLSAMTLGQFDQLARRFGYLPLQDAQNAIADLTAQVEAAKKAAVSGDAPPPPTAPPADTAVAEEVVELVEVEDLVVKTEPVAAPKPRGRRAAQATPPADPVPPKTGGTMPDEGVKPLDGEILPPENGPPKTIEDARAALTTLVAAKGMTVGRELLTAFGVAKVSALPIDKVGEFVKQAGKLGE